MLKRAAGFCLFSVLTFAAFFPYCVLVKRMLDEKENMEPQES